jgi:hypothetical protein
MSLRATCPSCGLEGDIEAFFVDGDGKRLAARFSDLDPALGRALLGYLRLFKPPKRNLRGSRALALMDELLELVRAGSVCKDERSGIRRPATSATWAAAIEQMLLQRDRLSLPLDGHGYLRAVAFGVAEQAVARAEQKAEEDKRAGRHRAAPGNPLLEARLYADRMVELAGWSDAQRDAHIAGVQARLGGEPA